MEYVIEPPETPSLAVAGAATRFPVRRIYCVGRNYAAHAREMGRDPAREPPFFFQKPADALVDSPAEIAYPPDTADLHHEIELVVAIGRGGAFVAPEDAPSLIWGYGVGVDLTRRDRQTELKKIGRPWEWGKAFDRSAPCGALRPASAIGHPAAGRIWLKVNGELRQEGDLSQLIWPASDILAAISRSMRLEPGDLIFTGTPSGVAAVGPGDRLEGGVDGVGTVAVAIAGAR
ncbi:MAG: fumarylacetoacetate hydrolase family protein [Caulobacterales bacterium]|nr:fumarylacetoacetate hydrolase family protein [Caulobacterales bacterium]